MEIGDLSLKELEKFEDKIPEFAGFISRNLVDNYNDFIKILYKDIDKIVFLKQENPELYQKDPENRITIDIVMSLKIMGYNAAHDTKIGGHTDISVKKNNYTWIGEAKIFEGNSSLWKGFQQLNTRYSTGDFNQKDGGLLIYIRNNNKTGKAVIDNWKNFLVSKKLKNYSTEECSDRPLSFFSKHLHDRSGQIFTVKHIPLLLNFNPQDMTG